MMIPLSRIRPFAVMACLALAPAVPALAQTASFDDLRALRYYLTQNDAPAAQAELRRLRTSFPDWRPPADLNDLLAPQASAGVNVDEAEIWRRIERNDFAGARGLIDTGRQQVAGWTPPTDMLRVLEVNEAQAAFDAATQQRDATGAIAIARRAPQIMSCERINNAWLLADMYVLAGQTAAAVTTYRNTVQSCTSYGQMQPSLEKASVVASRADLVGMFDTARTANPGARAQLDALQARLTGGAAPAAPVAQVALTAPRPAAVSAPAPATVVVAAPSAAPVVTGNLPLRGDPRLAEVRRLKEQEQYARCLAASTSPRSLELLYERSWCAYSHERPTEAMVGFQEAARAGDAIGPNVRRDAHFGLALSYLAMNMTEQGAQVASQVSLTDTQRREMETIILDQRGVKAYRQQDYRQAISNFNAMEQVNGSLRRDLALLRAYAYLNVGQRAVALEQFERLHAQLATAETRDGLNAARGQ